MRKMRDNAANWWISATKIAGPGFARSPFDGCNEAVLLAEGVTRTL
jgi:hypothetical protein